MAALRLATSIDEAAEASTQRAELRDVIDWFANLPMEKPLMVTASLVGLRMDTLGGTGC